MVELLISYRVPINGVNKYGTSSLFIVSQDGQIDIVKSLIDAGVEVDKHTNTHPLLVAALHGHNEVVDALLKAGSSVRTVDKNGNSALHMASRNNHLQTLR